MLKGEAKGTVKGAPPRESRSRAPSPPPARGDVVWARLKPVMGHEQAGSRPVLVVSVDSIQTKLGMAICIPLTSRSYQRPLGVEVTVTETIQSFARQSFALPGQIRMLSVWSLGPLLGRVSDRQLEACLDALLELCGRPVTLGADND